MSSKILKPYNKNHKTNAQTLRKTMTDAELILWSRVRNKQICNVQFNRQKPLGPYIVDFYASSVNLVIELDGGQHYEFNQVKKDQKRDSFLKSLGLIVLRFDNSQIFKELDAVLDVVYREIQKSLKPPASIGYRRSLRPPLQKGEI